MPNMSYCRFENTFQALKDCVDHWDDDLSEVEKHYKDQLVILCAEIAEEEGDHND